MIGKLGGVYRRIKRERRIAGWVRKGLKLGKNVSIVDTCFIDSAHCFLIAIDDNCTLAPNVTILAHDASTKAFLGYTKIKRVHIKENCFIGYGAVILPGVTVGPNAIVAAGSIVTHDVPPDTVFAGNPARQISDLSSYITKIRQDMEQGNKRVFGKDYYIGNLDDSRRLEIEGEADEIAYIL